LSVADSGSPAHRPGERRYWADQVDLAERRVWIGSEEARHLVRAMRHRPGDRVDVIDGSGRRYEVELEAPVKGAGRGRRRLAARILNVFEAEVTAREPWLIQALIRPERLDAIIDGATQLGVAGIALFQAVRSPTLPELGARRLERLVRLTRAATAQSLGLRLPELRGPLTFSELEALLGGFRVWVAHGPRRRDRADDPLADRWIEGADAPEGQPGLAHALVVGPEGGLTDEEIRVFAASGALLLDLGPRRLRSETAALAGLTLLGHHLRRSR
jgi:16S rRNA (uracil1498-N3)-methyltransferase